MIARRVAAIVMGLCLALSCGMAYAADYETELTDGFVPVELNTNDSTGGSGQPGSSDGSQKSTYGTEDPSTVESELVGGEDQDGGKDDGKDKPSSKGDSVTPTMSSPSISMDDGSRVTVDDDGHLTVVSPSETTSVLDDSRMYTVESNTSGEVTIRNDSGQTVEVKGTAVTYIDANGKKKTVDVSKKDATKDDDAAGKQSSGETELSDVTSKGVEDGEEQGDATKQVNASEASSAFPIVPVVAAVIAAAAIIAFAIWRRKK